MHGPVKVLVDFLVVDRKDWKVNLRQTTFQIQSSKFHRIQLIWKARKSLHPPNWDSLQTVRNAIWEAFVFHCIDNFIYWFSNIILDGREGSASRMQWSCCSMWNVVVMLFNCVDIVLWDSAKRRESSSLLF